MPASLSNMENQSQVPVPHDTAISTASNSARNYTTQQKAEAMEAFINSLKKKARRYDTPFDGRKRKEKVAKQRRARKANKKRKLYVRYGKQ